MFNDSTVIEVKTRDLLNIKDKIDRRLSEHSDQAMLDKLYSAGAVNAYMHVALLLRDMVKEAMEIEAKAYREEVDAQAKASMEFRGQE